MLDLILRNAQAAYDLRDRAQLEREAQLALAVSRRADDSHGLAVATLHLGLARRDLTLLECAARSFELCHDWYNAAVAWCVCSEYADQVDGLVYLSQALEHVERAGRQFAQRGDTVRWGAARDLEQAIYEVTVGVADGNRWISHAGSVV